MVTKSQAEQRIALISESEFCGGVSASVIDVAEIDFDGTFPDDFREFLLSFGAGHLDSEDLLGLGGQPYTDIVKVARHLRQPSTHARFPRSLVPIRADGFGNYDCIDLSASDESTSTVVAWQHDTCDNERPVFVSKGYWDWLLELLDMIDEDRA